MSESDECPVTLTDKAAAKILEIRADEKVPDEKGLRVAIQGGGCSGYTYVLDFDAAEPDDLVFTLKGVRVIIDRISAAYLAGADIDYLEGLNATGFKIVNPNAKRTCGCGSSFSTD